MGVSGVSLNFRMVKVDPFVTVRASVACKRDPSGSFPSTIGENTEICLPEIWQSRTRNELSSASESKLILVSISSYFR